MNRVVNVFSFVISAAYIIITVMIVYDLSFSSVVTLKAMPYKEEVTAGLAALLLFFGALRARRRWEGIKDMKRFSKFSFSSAVSKTARQSGMVISGLEIFFMFGFLYLCFQMYKLHPEFTVPMMVVLGLLLAESVLFMIRMSKGGDGFRLGVGPDVVAYFNREIHIFYYTGLLRVELIRDHINFQYKEDLNLKLPTEVIPPDQRKAFRDAILKELGDKNVYIDDAFRSFE